jgi:hypothetical protein
MLWTSGERSHPRWVFQPSQIKADSGTGARSSQIPHNSMYTAFPSTARYDFGSEITVCQGSQGLCCTSRKREPLYARRYVHCLEQYPCAPVFFKAAIPRRFASPKRYSLSVWMWNMSRAPDGLRPAFGHRLNIKRVAADCRKDCRSSCTVSGCLKRC